jgi:hypothetical protein
MIDFREEIEKFKPALEIEDLQETMSGGDTQDMMDVLQQITKLLISHGKEQPR